MKGSQKSKPELPPWRIKAAQWETEEKFHLPNGNGVPIVVRLVMRVFKPVLLLRCQPRPLSHRDQLTEDEFATLIDSDYASAVVLISVGGVEVTTSESYFEVTDRLAQAAILREGLQEWIIRPISIIGGEDRLQD